ncbi:ABC transporter ATP-binding protein [Streptosporangium sp. NBC_01755]|uniref:ABC transporter ATP-binding protein n=1 Tax=unclassified Streptosporangium TaxID=2632669 RepID=UPI002DDAF37D|nr:MULTISPECIES: ABC transporter ATP-binding protein [unclassified Streptosporangium]WSA27693.1 ABC transporter ATP-binding protein [Streptosporangium sp. NBC_01810]WSD00833.1 ABC transporter ATP-binding protein [Streptosporangium sp. NBC_01755]
MAIRTPGRRQATAASAPVDEDAWIEVAGLQKLYRPRRSEPTHALSDIGFTVRRGEFISVVGPSGCGKTTLLKILAGLIPRSEGVVRVAGRDVTKPLPEVGMVFQAATLLPWRTILENVMVPVEVQRLDAAVYREQARNLLNMVGLDGFGDKYPHELSGGMQQRAGICRALVHDPSVLLMDEPFGALDAMTREYMNVELLRIWKESGKTVVLVTHSIPEAVFLSDRVIVLSSRPGRIAEIVPIELGRPRDLSVMSSDRAGVYVSRIRQHFNAAGVID